MYLNILGGLIIPQGENNKCNTKREHRQPVLSDEFAYIRKLFFQFEDTFHGADLLALRGIMISFAFDAEIGVDFIEFLAFRNCGHGAFRFAGTAVNAILINIESH
jgi:hypothetical protein